MDTFETQTEVTELDRRHALPSPVEAPPAPGKRLRFILAPEWIMRRDRLTRELEEAAKMAPELRAAFQAAVADEMIRYGVTGIVLP